MLARPSLHIAVYGRGLAKLRSGFCKAHWHCFPENASAVFGVRTMDALMTDYLTQRKFALELLGIFAGVALLLASIGIYGVMNSATIEIL
jgi:hypothetical protein